MPGRDTHIYLNELAEKRLAQLRESDPLFKPSRFFSSCILSYGDADEFYFYDKLLEEQEKETAQIRERRNTCLLRLRNVKHKGITEIKSLYDKAEALAGNVTNTYLKEGFLALPTEEALVRLDSFLGREKCTFQLLDLVRDKLKENKDKNEVLGPFDSV